MKTSTICLVLAAVLASAPAGTGAASEGAAAGWSCAGVRHLSGLPGVAPKAVGKLWAGPQGIGFESGGATVLVESANILKVSTGDERVLKGGAFGRFVRSGIPAAGGLAIGLSGVSQGFSAIPAAVGFVASLASQGSEDIVTVEFMDARDGYHGAVFTMPRHAAEGIEQNVRANAMAANAVPLGSCAGGGQANAISLLPVAAEGVEVPAEDRVLVYERLIERLQKAKAPWQVERAGRHEASGGCGGWKLAITVDAFRKGNAVKRALMGPAGLFAGTTSLRYRIVVSDGRGAALLEEQMRSTVRGDRESLEVSEAAAKSIERKMETLRARQAAAARDEVQTAAR